MRRRRSLRPIAAACWLVACLAIPVQAFTLQPATAAQQALVRHHTNNDPAWTVLGRATISEDKAKGVLNAAFDPTLLGAAGRPFRISGYMTPLESRSPTRHFIITRRDTTCPFCPPNAPTEAVEVKLQSPLAFTREPVAVSGRLALVASSGEGLFFRLDDAAAVPAPG